MKQRDKDTTRAKLIRAVGQLIERDGFEAVGINAVAREADVDKVLIYRYFDGLAGLLEAFGRDGRFWWQVDQLMADPLPQPSSGRVADLLATVFERHVGFLRQNPVTLEILAWEMSERNELTAALETVREQRSLDLLDAIAEHMAVDASVLRARLTPALALLGASANYLAVRTRHIHSFSGISLATDQDWQELTEHIRLMLQGLDMPTHVNPSPKE